MLVKYRVAVIGGLAALCATVTGFIAVSGAIVGGEECPQVIEYGQELDYNASALMGDVTIEYAIDDETGIYRWSAVKPYKTGNYVIRARSERAFGITEYGEEFKFSIVAKPIDVKANADKETIYGDLPELTGDLFPEDTFSCDEFEIEDKNALETVVTPIASAVKITDKDGEDVTYCYKINVLSETITFTPRPITVESASATKVYDGKELTAKEFSISDGNCVYNQAVVSVSYKENIKDVGTSDNTVSEARVLSADGVDVTENYAINYKFGKLTVTKRPIKITTLSAEKVYDGEPLTCSDYDAEYVYPEDYEGERNLTALADGHKFEIKENFASIINVKESGKINSVIFDVKGGENNVTDNYDISYAYGTLTVTSRPLTVLTATESFEYDGEAHYNSDVRFINGTTLANNQSYKALENTIKQIVNVADSIEKNNVFTIAIYDKDDNDVTKNYDISYEYGTLTVTPRPITITTGTKEKIYDGKPLTCTDYEAVYTGDNSKDTFVNVEELDVKSSTSIINVKDGEVENKFIKCEITGGRGLLSNYDITFVWGKLKITPRPITITTETKEKVYDGTPLACTEYKAVYTDDSSKSAFVNDEELDVKESTSITDVGEILNKFTSYVIKNGKVSNYTITLYNTGKLKVTPRPIVIITGSAEKVYDGTPLTCTDYTTVYNDGENVLDGFVGDERIVVKASASITDVGTTDNTFTDYEIEKNITLDNYEILRIEYGTLTITKRKITLTAGSETKKYDGEPLTNDVISVTGEGLVDGDELKGVKTSGSQTGIGKSENKIDNLENITIVSKDGTDVTDNYEIKIKGGTLEVTDKDPNDDDDDDNKENDDDDNKKNDDDNNNNDDDNTNNNDDDGNSGSGAKSIGPGSYGNKGNKGNEQVGWIVSSVKEVVYLKDQSWGDYVDNQWQKSEAVFDGKIDEKYSFDDRVSYVLQLKDYAAKSGLTMDFGGSYYKPQYAVLGSKKSGSATQYEVSHYNVSIYSYLLNNNYSLSDEYKSLDDAYYEFVKNNYLNVGESTKAFLKEFMRENNITTLDDVVNYMTTQMTYNLLYDTSIDGEDDVVKALLSNEKYKKQGVCYHFATAATLMLRTLGIPARMTSGYMVECAANTETEILKQNAHGWVEVYIENLGWITVEVTPERDLSAELETLKEILKDHEITLIAPDEFKLYDGEPLIAPQSCEFDDETKALFDKYGITYSVTAVVDGSVIEGTTESVITSYTLKLSYNGLNVDIDNDNVKTQNGTLEVIKKDVVTVYIITSCTEYDGKSHEFIDDKIAPFGLPDGYMIEVKLSRLGSITKVGSLEYKRLYEYTTIKDKDGNDVTEDYFIRFAPIVATAQEKIVDKNHSFCFGENGLITITKRKLEITSYDATAVYIEGTTLKKEEAYITAGSLADGHTMEVIFTGERTSPGTSANSFTVKIYDESGRDVTSNYEITPKFGTLTLESET